MPLCVCRSGGLRCVITPLYDDGQESLAQQCPGSAAADLCCHAYGRIEVCLKHDGRRRTVSGHVTCSASSGSWAADAAMAGSSICCPRATALTQSTLMLTCGGACTSKQRDLACLVHRPSTAATTSKRRCSLGAVRRGYTFPGCNFQLCCGYGVSVWVYRHSPQAIPLVPSFRIPQQQRSAACAHLPLLAGRGAAAQVLFAGRVRR